MTTINTGWKRSLTIRVKKIVGGEVIEPDLVIDGKNDSGFLSAYGYVAIDDDELAQLPLTSYQNRLNDLISYMRGLPDYVDVRVEVIPFGGNPLYVTPESGAINVTVTEQAYIYDEEACPPDGTTTSTTTCALLNPVFVEYAETDELICSVSNPTTIHTDTGYSLVEGPLYYYDSCGTMLVNSTTYYKDAFTNAYGKITNGVFLQEGTCESNPT